MAVEIAPSEVSEQITTLANELDIDRPGWAYRVDLDSLDMTSVYACVLGQVYGADSYSLYLSGWAYGLDRLEARFGPDPSRGQVTVKYRDPWIEQIMQRRTEPAGDFSYGLRSQADRARLLQQRGINPPPHRFQPDPNIPHMCCFEGCYATLEARKAWHIEAFFVD